MRSSPSFGALSDGGECAGDDRRRRQHPLDALQGLRGQMGTLPEEGNGQSSCGARSDGGLSHSYHRLKMAVHSPDLALRPLRQNSTNSPHVWNS